jgi:glyoxalase family protein
MIDQIKGLHHVTSMAGDARTNNQFFTNALGLASRQEDRQFRCTRRVSPLLWRRDRCAGHDHDLFPVPEDGAGPSGHGRGRNDGVFDPEGSLGFWSDRLAKLNAGGLKAEETFGEKRLNFAGPDGDGFALVEVKDDGRLPWTHGGISEDHAIRGFHSVAMRLRDDGATSELLKFMGYELQEERDGVKRLIIPGGNGAHLVDLETMPNISRALPGAGSVHHVAFAVENREKQLEVRKALMDTGYQVTPVIDRDYFWAIYFRTPGGVLFEVATNEPGFNRDEDTASRRSAEAAGAAPASARAD